MRKVTMEKGWKKVVALVVICLALWGASKWITF